MSNRNLIHDTIREQEQQLLKSLIAFSKQQNFKNNEVYLEAPLNYVGDDSEARVEAKVESESRLRDVVPNDDKDVVLREKNFSNISISNSDVNKDKLDLKLIQFSQLNLSNIREKSKSDTKYSISTRTGSETISNKIKNQNTYNISSVNSNSIEELDDETVISMFKNMLTNSKKSSKNINCESTENSKSTKSNSNCNTNNFNSSKEIDTVIESKNIETNNQDKYLDNLLSVKDFLRTMKNKSKQNLFFKTLKQSSNTHLLQAANCFIKNIHFVFEDPYLSECLVIFYEMLITSQFSHLSSEFLSKFDLNFFYTNRSSIILDNTHYFIIEVIKYNKKEDLLEIFNQLNHPFTIEMMIEDQFASQVLLQLIQLAQELTNPQSFFNFLNNNFVYYSHQQISTYIIQGYIEHFHNINSSILDIITSKTQELSTTRNGCFVLIKALQHYSKKRLVKAILDKAEVYSKGKYSSTVVEYLFREYDDWAINYFIENKLEFILEFIEDNYANYIIQKVIKYIEDQELRKHHKKMLKKLIEIIPMINNKKNIKEKWEKLLKGSLALYKEKYHDKDNTANQNYRSETKQRPRRDC